MPTLIADLTTEAENAMDRNDALVSKIIKWLIDIRLNRGQIKRGLPGALLL